MTKVMVRLGAAGVLAVAGTAIGAGYSGLTPAATALRTAAQEAGEYQLTTAAAVVDGAGGSFNSVNIYVPWLLDSTDALQNSAAVANVNGVLSGAVSTFLGAGMDANATALLAGLGTTDAAGGAVGSNNVFLYEGRKIQHGAGFFLSDIASVIADDGRVALSARFNSSFGQNNVDISGLGIYPPSNTGGITGRRDLQPERARRSSTGARSPASTRPLRAGSSRRRARTLTVCRSAHRHGDLRRVRTGAPGSLSRTPRWSIATRAKLITVRPSDPEWAWPQNSKGFPPRPVRLRATPARPSRC
ncbi:MAG: hypothetical protein R3B46_04305 [Phycisphaerales bacterium]